MTSIMNCRLPLSLLIAIVLISGIATNRCLGDLETDTSIFDAGEIFTGNSHRFSIPVLNNSDSVCEISDLLPSCACTNTACGKKHLSPHERTEVAFFTHPREYPGLYTGYVRIYYKIKNIEKTLDVKFQEEVVSLVEGLPQNIDWGSVNLNADIPVKTFILKRDSSKIMWDDIDISCQNGLFSSTLSKIDNTTFKVTLKPTTKDIGGFRDRLIVNFLASGKSIGKPLISTLSIRTFSDQLKITPNAAYFGVVSLGEVRTLDLLLSLNKGDKVSTASSDLPPYISIKQKSQEGSQITLTVVFLADNVTGNRSFQIPLKITNDKSQTIAFIPCLAYVMPTAISASSPQNK